MINGLAMPIYEYRCKNCGDFEEMQRITDPPLGRCPTCGGSVRRLISNTSFQLKGSGWYVTDYARAGAGNGAKKAGGAESPAAAETKPAGGTETKSTTSTTGASEKSAS
jgi:putative FmdB family regulatory protein